MKRSVLLALVVAAVAAVSHAESPPIIPAVLNFVPTCMMKKVVGKCRAAMPRYYFDGKKCTKFTYGGCGGNANNFKTVAECRSECKAFMNGKGPIHIRKPMPKPNLSATYFWRKIAGTPGNQGKPQVKPLPQCLMKKVVGKCRAAMPRYYFDGKKCTKFTYGGCGGNANNFKTVAECRSQCKRFMNGNVNQSKTGTTTYVIKVYTAKKGSAGTDANVFINIGGTGKIFLKNSKTNKGAKKFETGKLDIFEVQLRPILLKSIVIGHDNKGSGPGWFLDKVVIYRKDRPRLQVTFKCNRWLAKDDGDKRIVRRLTVASKPKSRLATYVVKVYTAKKGGAGTDANVFINIGRTGKKLLKHSKTQTARWMFESGKMDMFEVQTRPTRLNYIVIGHDNKGRGPGWFLEKVVVYRKDRPRQQITFKCNRWLARDEGDKRIVRRLKASK